ncbi:MAG TPA: dihydrofolate reductase family protein [Solirubrobacteraceae bacterium]|nr:dihydrofolate reductase family protein [Solirubrobacteraceae bacterium]
MRRLHPDPAPVDPVELLPAALARAREDAARGSRPHVLVNFIASVDGRATVEGRSTGLGDDGDRRIFRALRGCADAVLAGTGTLAAEHYGTLARDPTVVALRERLGLVPQPPLVTITRSGHVPEIPLLADPRASLIVYTGAELDLAPVAASVHVERMDPLSLTPRAVLGHLHREHGVRLLLCEGGPALFGALLAADCFDELFLTLAPLLVGGPDLPITDPVRLAPRPGLRLIWALEQDDSLYLRYACAREARPTA